MRAGRPMHGKTSRITHDGTGIFDGPAVAAAGRALSLAGHRIRRACRRRCGWWPRALDDGEIMAVEHREHPVVGVQFHPESAATQHGYAMLERFLHGERARASTACPRAPTARATTSGVP